MKRVRCPKCDNYIVFDETQYAQGQQLVFQCPQCQKQFGIRIGTSRLRDKHEERTLDEQANAQDCGSIVVVENVFHYKQVIPLRMGDNVIGRYVRGTDINTPIETTPASIRNTASSVCNATNEASCNTSCAMHRRIRARST